MRLPIALYADFESILTKVDNAKLEVTKLPTKEEFYSLLNEGDISDGDYKHAEEMWKLFDCKNLGDYSDLYLIIDVLLLADIFEAFHNKCLKTFKLDPCYYFTASGLAWDAALKYTDVTLELLTDYDMHMMLERGIRGGITQCCKRYAKANNPLVEGYDSAKENSFILYLDSNNLYGYSMSQSLPKTLN
ncbi:hypothetical protein B566_EDAN016733 [Ephemera danica]|nr:hypothetical protein B566_EDAN016733 [Ephemera danica]